MATHIVTLNDINRRLILLENASTTASGTDEKVFHAEYPGGVVTDLGSGTTGGTLTTDYDTTDNFNYYQWTSANVALQDNTVVVGFVLPPNFAGWSATALNLSYLTSLVTNTDCKIKINVLKNGTSVYSEDDITSASIDWTDKAIASSSLGAWTAGDKMTIQITMYAKSSNYVQIGDLKLAWIC